MSNKNYFLINKLINNLSHNLTRNLKSNKLIIILFLIVLSIIFLVNYNSLFKIIEGNRPCKFTQQAQMENQISGKAEKYKKDMPNLDNSKSILNNVDDLKGKTNR